jgi:hypothetical protein
MAAHFIHWIIRQLINKVLPPGDELEVVVVRYRNEQLFHRQIEAIYLNDPSLFLAVNYRLVAGTICSNLKCRGFRVPFRGVNEATRLGGCVVRCSNE